MSLHSTAYATYLPAVNAGYAKCVSSALPQGRRFPNGYGLKDLAFWEPNNLWHYPFALHSIGQFKVGDYPSNAITKRNRLNSTLIGDSGGFQIGMGTMTGLQHVQRNQMKPADAINAWSREVDARQWITNWLQSKCDYSMTIDMPLWAMGKKGKNSPFHLCTADQLIDATVKNLREIDQNAHPESKWLNVIQGGQSISDTIKWWDAVKWFRRGGWALAGSAGASGGLHNMLLVLLHMRDEGAFAEQQNWLHVLGVSTPFWAVALTAIQKALRASNPEIVVSFDSSSPFQSGGRYEVVCLTPNYTRQLKSWSIATVEAPQRPSYASANNMKLFPYRQSPLGQIMLVNHLNVREGMWEKRTFDTISNIMLMNHNTWVYLDAFKTANDLVDRRGVGSVPPSFLKAVDFIAHVFSVQNWRTELANNKQFLDSVAPP